MEEEVELMEASSFHTNERRRRLSGQGLLEFRRLNQDDSSSSPTETEDCDQETEEVAPRRSTRRRFRSVSPPKVTKEVKQRKLKEHSSLRDIENYYLDKKVKKTNPSLETIFEEPQVSNNEDVVMSSRKFRRVIDFKPPTVKNNSKIRKRKMKAKLVNCKKPKKLSLKFLMDKLAEVSDE